MIKYSYPSCNTDAVQGHSPTENKNLVKENIHLIFIHNNKVKHNVA